MFSRQNNSSTSHAASSYDHFLTNEESLKLGKDASNALDSVECIGFLTSVGRFILKKSKLVWPQE